MILLTFCRLFPQELHTRVRGLVLTSTKHTSLMGTVEGAPFFTVIKAPVPKLPMSGAGATGGVRA